MEFSITEYTVEFIGFDGYTGSMQPAYRVTSEGGKFPKGTLIDGFLYPVKEENKDDFLAALFE